MDNLHKAPDFSNLEPRMRFKSLSNKIKDVAVRNKACIIATVEYKKLPVGTIPSNDAVAETRALAYDANYIGHMYNDMHEKQLGACCLHEHGDEYLPRIRMVLERTRSRHSRTECSLISFLRQVCSDM